MSTASVLVGVGEAVAVGIAAGPVVSNGRLRVESEAPLPLVGQSVAIRVDDGGLDLENRARCVVHDVELAQRVDLDRADVAELGGAAEFLRVLTRIGGGRLAGDRIRVEAK